MNICYLYWKDLSMYFRFYSIIENAGRERNTEAVTFNSGVFKRIVFLTMSSKGRAILVTTFKLVSLRMM